MSPFLKEILQSNASEFREVVLRDYESADGYTVTDCPYFKCKNGVGWDGEDAAIPSTVMYQIATIVVEMRKEGVLVKQYYHPK